MLRPLQQYELELLNTLTQKAQLGNANQGDYAMLKEYTERYLAYNPQVQQNVQSQYCQPIQPQYKQSMQSHYGQPMHQPQMRQPTYEQPMYQHRQYDIGNNPGTYKYTTKEDHCDDNIKVDKKDKLILNLRLIKSCPVDFYTKEEKMFLLDHLKEFEIYLDKVVTKRDDIKNTEITIYDDVSRGILDDDFKSTLEIGSLMYRTIIESFKIHLSKKAKKNTSKLIYVNLSDDNVSGFLPNGDNMVFRPSVIDTAVQSKSSRNSDILHVVKAYIRKEYDIILVYIYNDTDMKDAYKLYKGMETITESYDETLMEVFYISNRLCENILNKEEVYLEDVVETDTDKVNVSIMTIKENFKFDEIKMSLTESVFEKLGFGFIEMIMRDNILLYAYNKRDEMDDTLYKVIVNKKDNELLISNDGITFKINRRHFGLVSEFDKICKVRYRNIDTLKEVFTILEELDVYHKTYFDRTYDINNNEKKTIISDSLLPWTFGQAVYR